MKSARLLKPVNSKQPGKRDMKVRKVGALCRAHRHPSGGGWVLWFGREFAIVDNIDLADTLTFEI